MKRKLVGALTSAVLITGLGFASLPTIPGAEPQHAYAATVYHYDLHGYIIKKSGKYYFRSKVMGDQLLVNGKGGYNQPLYEKYYRLHSYLHVEGNGTRTTLNITRLVIIKR